MREPLLHAKNQSYTANDLARGVGLTFLTQVVLKEVNPGLTVLISPNWIFAAIMLALAGAAAGALYPALRAATYDPVVALAYE